MEKKRVKQIIFGIVLGVAVGLLFDSLLLLATSAWLAVAILPVLLPVIIAASVFGILGMKGLLPALPWWCVLLVMLIGWPIAYQGPIWVVETHFRLIEYREIPMYYNTEKISTQIVAIRGDGGRWMSSKFKAKGTNYKEVAVFYKEELAKKGWNVSEGHSYRNYNANSKKYSDGIKITAKKKSLSTSISFQEGIGDKQDIQEQFTLIYCHLGFE